MKKLKTFFILTVLFYPMIVKGNSVSDTVNIKQVETVNLLSAEQNVSDTSIIKLKRYYNISKAVPYLYVLGTATQCVGLAVALGESSKSYNQNRKKENAGVILIVSGGILSTFSPAIASIAASSSRNYLVTTGEDPGSHYCWAWWAGGIGLKIVGSISTANEENVIVPAVLSLIGESLYFVGISKSIRYTRSNYTKKQLNISLHPYKAENNSLGLALQCAF